MSADLNCPYCNADLEVCHDDGFGYEEDRDHEMECYKCDKAFTFTTSISLYYEAKCAEGTHDFEEWRSLEKQEIESDTFDASRYCQRDSCGAYEFRRRRTK